MKTLLAIYFLTMLMVTGHAQTNYACSIAGSGGTFIYGTIPSITVQSNYLVSGSVIADGNYTWDGTMWICPGTPDAPSLTQSGGVWTIFKPSFGNPSCSSSIGAFTARPDSPQTWTDSGWIAHAGVLPWTTIPSVGVDVVTLTSTNCTDWLPFATNHFEIPSVQPQQFFRSVLTISQPQ